MTVLLYKPWCNITLQYELKGGFDCISAENVYAQPSVLLIKLNTLMVIIKGGETLHSFFPHLPFPSTPLIQ